MHVLTESEHHQDWATPPYIVWGLAKELNLRFTFDACASEANHKAPKYLTAEQNALAPGDWTGRREEDEAVWCNPPYEDPGAWVAKAAQQSSLGPVVMLLPASISTNWFYQTQRRFPVFLYRQRIQFLPPPGVVAKDRSSVSNCAVLLGGVHRYAPGIQHRYLDAKTGLFVQEG